jgi:hypothetical protein
MVKKPNTGAENGRKDYLKWAGAGVQMVATIGGLAALGWWLDQKYQNKIPGWTLALSLLGCVLSIYYLIRSFLR